MSLKRKEYYLDNLIFLIIIAQVIVFRYFNVHEIINKVIILLIALRIIISIIEKELYIKKNFMKPFILFVCLICLLIGNALVFGINDYFVSNVLMIFYPLVFVGYMSWYLFVYEQKVYQMLLELKGVINIYFLLNIVVLIIQTKHPGFLAGRAKFVALMEEDLMSGLFGYQMTATLCFFSVFVVIYNNSVRKTIQKRFNRYMFIGYSIISTVIISYLSTINDNVGFFVLLFAALLIIFFSKNNLKKSNSIKKITILGICGLSVAVTFILLFPNLYSYLYDNAIFKIVGAIKHAGAGASVTHGSMERIALFVYGFQHANGWYLGNGLSDGGFYTPYLYDFAHFGNANIGAFVCLGGIWFALSLVLLYASLILININKLVFRKKKSYYRFTMIFFYVLVSFFSVAFTDISIAICTQFVFIAFWFDAKVNDNIQ